MLMYMCKKMSQSCCGAHTAAAGCTKTKQRPAHRLSCQSHAWSCLMGHPYSAAHAAMCPMIQPCGCSRTVHTRAQARNRNHHHAQERLLHGHPRHGAQVGLVLPLLTRPPLWEREQAREPPVPTWMFAPQMHLPLTCHQMTPQSQVPPSGPQAARRWQQQQLPASGKLAP